MHRVTDATSAIARLSPSGERHPIDTEGRVIIDHNGSRIERSYQLGCGVQPLSEARSLKSKGKRVCASDGLILCVVSVDSDSGTKYFRC